MQIQSTIRYVSFTVALIAGVMFVTVKNCQAQTPETTQKLADLRTKATNYLKTSQADDGSWTSPNVPGVTGLVVTGMLRSGVPANDPAVAKGLKFLEGLVQPDGGIYFAKSSHRNYESCIAVLAFTEANKDGKYTKLIAGADKFLRQQQWDQEEGKKEDDPEFGGAGYGSKSRPDLSNTQFLVEALKAAGATAND
ncbi:MAG: squalene/oxidosqualene cyclase, partial [Planctomycetaceae bacterium]|nr:squalene/oxidosqualene cyclase [Planctomycetaceae bacterium]